MKIVIILGVLLLLVSCSSGAQLREEWPEVKVEKNGSEEIVVQEEQELIISSKDFSLIQDREELLLYNDQAHLIRFDSLLGADKAKLFVNDSSFIVTINKTISHKGLAYRLKEVHNATAIPRRSFVDMSVGGNRGKVFVNEMVVVQGRNVSVDFVGLQDGFPRARIVTGEESVILGDKDEHKFDAFWVYMHKVYFNSAEEFDVVQSVSLSVS